MEAKVGHFRGAGPCLVLSLLVLCSCQRAGGPPDAVRPEKGFGNLGGSTFQSLGLQRKSLSRERELLEMELQWLDLRQRQVEAEIELRQAMEFENALALEMARFGEMDKRLPGEKGFIEPSQRRAWETRLLGRKRETEKAAARVRLVDRDMKDLLGKITHRGFLPPASQAGQTGKLVPEPVVP